MLIAFGQVVDKTTDAVIWGGTCFETLIEHFPRDAQARRMTEVFHRWSNNYMRRGTPAQEHFLRHAQYPGYPTDFLAWAESALQNAGLLVDIVDESLDATTRWRYGEGYLHEAIPLDLHAEIVSWSRDPKTVEVDKCAEL